MPTKLTGNGVQLSQLSADPSSPVVGQVYLNTQTSKMRMWDGVAWSDVSKESDFLNHQIITTSFVYGGYKSSSPWKNVNQMSHATDIMVNHGDILTKAGSYVSGACGLVNAYIWGADNTWPGNTTECDAFSMVTLTAITPPAMLYARNDSGTIQKEHEKAWILMGGNANCDVFDLTTETMAATDQGIIAPNAGDTMQSGAGTHFGETKGYWWNTLGGGKFTFATQTFDTGPTGGNGSQQKGISSKFGIGYAGNEGSYMGGYNLRRTNYGTDTTAGTIPKPIGNCGEENLDMGQHHQYMMGMYDGAQNNRGWKFAYTTDNGYELGAGSVRTGVAGGSSGHCAWK